MVGASDSGRALGLGPVGPMDWSTSLLLGLKVGEIDSGRPIGLWSVDRLDWVEDRETFS